MNEGPTNSANLLDTTDYLEAVGVFRGWKNSLFVIVLLSLLLLQASFWLVNTGYVKTEDKTGCDLPAAVSKDTEKISQTAQQPAAAADKIENAAKQTTPEPNQPAKALQQPQSKKTGLTLHITFKHLAWLIRLVNFVLIPAAVLYCLTMMFALKVSLLGRLGGINHIARAFFISLVFVVFLLPWWQVLFGDIFKGFIFTPYELLSRYNALCEASIFTKAFYYLRFVIYWLVMMLMLILAQFRSIRWSKAMLRRLEIIV